MSVLTPSKKRKGKGARDKDSRDRELLKRIHDDLKEANETRSVWVEQARECENFRNGHQWDEADEAILEEQKRPKITFNLIRRVVDAIVGTEIQHRQRILFLPRKPSNVNMSGASDLATDSVDWAIELARGPHERSQMFRDCTIRGVGAGSYRLDYEEDPDGRLVIDRVDSMEMWWDPSARRQNLEDARWIARKRLWRREEVEEEFGKSLADTAVGDSDSVVPPFGPGSDSDSPTRIVNYGSNPFAYGGQKVTPGSPEKALKGMVEVIERQWWEREKFYRVLEEVEPPAEAMPMPGMDTSLGAGLMPPGDMTSTPPPGAPGPVSSSAPGGADLMMPPGGQDQAMPGMAPGGPGMDMPPGMPPGPPPPPPDHAEPTEKWVNLSVEEYEKVAARLAALGQPPPQAVKMTRRRYKQAYIAGNTLLREDDMWIDGFSYLFMTWDWDSKEKVWYGLVRDLRDPQKGANKWFSQGVHHFNSSAKGTVFVETNAVVDPENLATNYAKPGAIIQVKPGMLAAGAVKVEHPPPFPEAVSTMIQYSMQALREIPGVNMDLLGQSEGDAAGVTVQKRQTQGLTILAPLFDALTRFRESEAKLVLRILKKFFLDGRLIRVGDPHQFEYKPLLAEQFAEDYDMVIDDAPRDPNQMRAVWDTMNTIMPLLVRQNGDLPDVFKDMAPLPTSLKSEWKKESAMKAQAPPPPPSLEDDPRMIEAKIALTQAQATLALARADAMKKQAGMSLVETSKDMTIEERRMTLDEKQAGTEARERRDENTLDALDTVKRLSDPDFPGVRAG